MKHGAVIYTRVSSDDQVNGTSLEFQLEACKRWIVANGYYEVAKFVEEGESAQTDQRTEFIKAIDFCKKNKDQVRVLVVYKTSRFARNTQDHLGIRTVLLKHEIILRSATEPLSEDPTGEFMETLLAAANTWENKVRRENAINGVMKRLEQGRWPFKAPYGYIKKDGVLVPSEQAGSVVRLFELMATGTYKVSELVTVIEGWGIRIDEKRLHYLLRNSIYYGWLNVGGNESDVIIYDGVGVHEPLVSKELFFKVQSVLQKNSNHTPKRIRDNELFPLKHVLLCHTCQRPLTGSTRHAKGKADIDYYHCYDNGHVRVRREKMEQQFISYLDRIKPKPEVVAVIKAKLERATRKVIEDSNNNIITIDRELESLRKQKKNLGLMRASEEITADEFKSLSGDVQEKILKLEVKRSEARVEEVNGEYLLSVAESFFERASTMWEEAPLIYKKKIQRIVFPKGVVVMNKEGTLEPKEVGIAFALSGLSTDPGDDGRGIVGWFEPIKEFLQEMQEVLNASGNGWIVA